MTTTVTDTRWVRRSPHRQWLLSSRLPFATAALLLLVAVSNNASANAAAAAALIVPSSSPLVSPRCCCRRRVVGPPSSSSFSAGVVPCLPPLFATGHDSSSSSSSSSGSSRGGGDGVNDEIAALMSEHDPILLFASRLLPPSVASDASALYAWCRRLDEIVDDPKLVAFAPGGGHDGGGDGDPALGRSVVLSRLDEWERRFEELWAGRPVDAMDAALAETIERRRRVGGPDGGGLGREPFVDMMAGMRADVDVGAGGRRIATRDELEEYAYQVAGTVGLMLLPLLLGPNDDVNAARGPAIALGQAIQLVNILRDATPDAELGRIYLPQDELRAEGVEERDVLSLQSSPGYRNVVRSVSDRAAELLSEAEAGRGTLPGLGPLFVQVIVELYRGYLERLEGMGYDNLSPGGERVKIGTVRKLTASIRAVREVLFSGR